MSKETNFERGIPLTSANPPMPKTKPPEGNITSTLLDLIAELKRYLDLAENDISSLTEQQGIYACPYCISYSINAECTHKIAGKFKCEQNENSFFEWRGKKWRNDADM